AGFHFGTDQLLDGAALFPGTIAGGRLAHGDLALGWRAGVQFFLGDVELLLVPKMDLSHTRSWFFADFRDADTRVWRLHSVRAGAVCAEEFPLAKRAAAGGGRSRRGPLTHAPSNHNTHLAPAPPQIKLRPSARPPPASILFSAPLPGRPPSRR